jgi:hypothetical protein
MKRTLVFLATIGIAALMGSTAVAAQSLGQALADLESHVKWSAVDGAWRSLRPGWVRTTTACQDAACVAAQLITFEENVKWAAVDKEWKIRRSGWVRDCHNATADRDVAKLLLEFEENVRWRAVDEAWKERRAAWVVELKGG